MLPTTIHELHENKHEGYELEAGNNPRTKQLVSIHQ
jgi:hypothetical protein